jgi:ubiquinone/menaquinone biosynthesis C-methylase UbiE
MGRYRIVEEKFDVTFFFQALSAADNTFHYVFCVFGVMFMPDADKALQEMYRVLKKGGKATVLTWSGNLFFRKLYAAGMVVFAHL